MSDSVAVPRDLYLSLKIDRPPRHDAANEVSGEGYARAGAGEAAPDWGVTFGSVSAIPFPEGDGYWLVVFDAHTQEVITKWPAEVHHGPGGKSIHVMHEAGGWTADRRRTITLQLRDKHMIALFEWEPVLVDGGR